MPGVLEKVSEDKLNGVKFTVEPSSINCRLFPSNVWVTAIVRRKQKPPATGKFPDWAKPVKRGYKICFWTAHQFFDKTCIGIEDYIAALTQALSKRSTSIYVTDYKPPKQNPYKQDNTNFKEIYDIDGHFVFRVVEEDSYGADDEDST